MCNGTHGGSWNGGRLEAQKVNRVAEAYQDGDADCRLACACTPCRRYACVVLCGCGDLTRTGHANLTCTWASSAGSVGFARGRGGRRWRRGSPFPAPGTCGAPLPALPRTVQHRIGACTEGHDGPQGCHGPAAWQGGPRGGDGGRGSGHHPRPTKTGKTPGKKHGGGWGALGSVGHAAAGTLCVDPRGGPQQYMLLSDLSRTPLGLRSAQARAWLGLRAVLCCSNPLIASQRFFTAELLHLIPAPLPHHALPRPSARPCCRPAPPPHQSDVLPAGWVAKESTSHPGKIYFFNTITGVRSTLAF
jgi:hypothetical protein